MIAARIGQKVDKVSSRRPAQCVTERNLGCCRNALPCISQTKLSNIRAVSMFVVFNAFKIFDKLLHIVRTTGVQKFINCLTVMLLVLLCGC